MSILTIKTGILSNADGSSEFYMDGYGVICSVIGPAPVKSRLEIIDQVTIEVNLQAFGRPPSLMETGIASRIKRIIEYIILRHLHPRSLISINIQPLTIGVPVMTVLLNACFMALYDAAIPMNGLYVAIPISTFTMSILTTPAPISNSEMEVMRERESSSSSWCVIEVHDNSIIDARIKSLAELGNVALKAKHVMDQMKEVLIR
jgi:ribonuclease PH